MFDRAAASDVLATLRRRPDVEAPNLHAVDAADRLILDIAADAVTPIDRIVVVGDRYGALTLGAAAGFGATGIRTHQDPITGERALAANAAAAGMTEHYVSLPLGPELLDGATIVLMQLPRALAELDEIADAIARYAAPEVRVFAGGRDKHLSTSMNDVLGTSFASVVASRGRQKSRVLTASSPKQVGEPRYPVSQRLDDWDVTVFAHGAVFAGAGLDIGTRALLPYLRDAKPGARTAIDLGCGSGILATVLARQRPGLDVIATDRSAAATASAALTARASGATVTVVRDDAMSTFDDASADLVVCNPPFHLGAAVHTGAAERMFDAAARVLRSGGELWTVYNNHLGYSGALTAAIGPTTVIDRGRKFTVAQSVRR
ncbi:methyltransferase domain-containing protein [Rhodococcus rhodnii]|uniref:rRNA (Guanine-N(2)-)-methyltransferase n=2 Tax=Rhodococcus rhodnii TaxID=38312 RepID=R7WJW1_9NOCA|nr:methyltransferase [Rhodococcus rhodnii]EOM75592.1 rRNA (guanine-N(2)-)-methyltransferase [Rhodococcus rhodnii LMG 5362]TXG91884.1 methyltransferase domain-containing protein [Rhodococcus rhodnii]